MYCKNCGEFIPDNLVRCPYCEARTGLKRKKPIYKRWWFWVITIFLALAVIGSMSGTETPDPTEPSTPNVTENAPTENAPIPEAPAVTEPPATDAPAISDNATMGEKNALRTAKNYLDFTAFSYSGLIKQLEFEGYSTEEAAYGADNCGANWREQAQRATDNYLDFTAFSHSGLVKQLEFDGYTTEDATYAADNCGADWFEQAAKSAKNYLEYTAFSKDGLIEQLEFEGYTHEQAVYGAEQNGY